MTAMDVGTLCVIKLRKPRSFVSFVLHDPLALITVTVTLATVLLWCHSRVSVAVTPEPGASCTVGPAEQGPRGPRGITGPPRAEDLNRTEAQIKQERFRQLVNKFLQK